SSTWRSASGPSTASSPGATSSPSAGRGLRRPHTIVPLIEEAIAGRTLLVTGTTGFLGKSVVEKLLRALPQVGRIHLAIRSSARRPARDRVEREVLASPAFRRLKKDMGEDAFRRLAAEKLSVMELDLGVDGLG